MPLTFRLRLSAKNHQSPNSDEAKNGERYT